MAEAKKAAGALFDWLDRDRDFVRRPLSCRVGGGALDCSRADLRPPHKLDVQFSRIQLSRNGTLDRRELRGRVDAKEFAAADPDKDGTLTKDEYFTIVEKRFKAVDPDNDGTVSADKIAHQGGPRVAAPAGVLERVPVQMNRDASRFSRWRISFFGKPASTFPGYALGRTGATV